MAKIQANPNDADALMSLGDEFYTTGDYATAGQWFTKVTQVEPGNVVSGAMLVGLGVLMVTNLLARLAALTAPLGG